MTSSWRGESWRHDQRRRDHGDSCESRRTLNQTSSTSQAVGRRDRSRTVHPRSVAPAGTGGCAASYRTTPGGSARCWDPRCRKSAEEQEDFRSHFDHWIGCTAPFRAARSAWARRSERLSASRARGADFRSAAVLAVVAGIRQLFLPGRNSLPPDLTGIASPRTSGSPRRGRRPQANARKTPVLGQGRSLFRRGFVRTSPATGLLGRLADRWAFRAGCSLRG